jgi:serralysin
MAGVELFSVFGGVNMRDLRDRMTGAITNLVADGNDVVASYAGGLTVIFHGTGLTFAGNATTGGTVTAFDWQLSDGTLQTVARFTGLIGWTFADVDNTSKALFAATPIFVQDTIGSDQLMGGAKADRFSLGGGEDPFNQWGADTIYGGAGNDTVILDTDNVGVVEPGYDRAHVLNMGEGNDAIIIRNSFLNSGYLSLIDASFSSVETLDLRDGAQVEINSTAFGKNLISPVGTIRTNLGTLRITMDFDNAVTIAGMKITGTMDIVDFRGNALNNGITGNAATRDLIGGEAGNDRLSGLGGRDTINGGDGDDRIASGANNDRLTGGAGSDLFIFVKGGGQDRITDFTPAGADADTIDLHKLLVISTFADLKAHHLRQVGDDAVIEGNGTTIILANIDVDDLRRSDFVF